jgi:hypothetical protein
MYRFIKLTIQHNFLSLCLYIKVLFATLVTLFVEKFKILIKNLKF